MIDHSEQLGRNLGHTHTHIDTNKSLRNRAGQKIPKDLYRSAIDLPNHLVNSSPFHKDKTKGTDLQNPAEQSAAPAGMQSSRARAGVAPMVVTQH